MFSTIPRNLVEKDASCVDHPYSDCGPFEFRNAIGTSFAAPQVSAAAALLLGQRRRCAPSRSHGCSSGARRTRHRSRAARCARPAATSTRAGACSTCSPPRRCSTDGTQLPAPDRLEPNDDAGPWAHALPPLPRTVDASLDYWDDNIDVYRVHLNARAKLFARLTGNGRAQAGAVGARDTSTSRASTSTRRRVSRRDGRPAPRCASPTGRRRRASTTSR